MTDRFATLQAACKADSHPPLFVSQSAEASRLIITQLDGSRDAKFLLVRAGQSASNPLRETIGYRPEVAGTALIYDLSAETMQGKARPFACTLAKGETKVYAILPVQIEAIAVRIESTEKGRIPHVEFHDARGERLQAILPFHLRIENSEGKPLVQGYYATDRDGRFASQPQLLADAPAGSRVVIRSQLTGNEKSLLLER